MCGTVYSQKSITGLSLRYNVDSKNHSKDAPSFSLALDNEGCFYFVISLYTKDDYYPFETISNRSIDFTDIDGNNITLQCDSINPIWKFPFYKFSTFYAFAGHAGSPRMYHELQIYFKIPDINDFLSHTYMKFNACSGVCSSDMTDSPKKYRKFNKHLRNAQKTIIRTLDYDAYHLDTSW